MQFTQFEESGFFNTLKAYRPLFFFAITLLFVSVIWAGWRMYSSSNLTNQENSPTPTLKQLSIEDSVMYPGQDDQTALELLEKNSDSLQIENGKVTAINGRTPKQGSSWYLYADGIQVQESPNDFTTSSGTVIEWRIEEDQPQP